MFEFKRLSRRHFLLGGSAGLVLLPLSGFARTGKFLSTAQCSVIPSETDGPYPAHSDERGVNYLSQPGAVRRDIRGSLISSQYPGLAVAVGVPLTMRMRIVDATKGCSPLEGAAVYVWHCDGRGDYSMYNEAVKTETYLRGVQIADQDGWVEFETIYPGCYESRAVHIHFDVFKDAKLAVDNKSIAKISQFAFPDEVSAEVYGRNKEQYPNGLENLNQNPLNEDSIFADGYDLQVASIRSGTATAGLVAEISVAVDPTNVEDVSSGGPPPGGGPGWPLPPPPGARPPRRP
ncbi:MAG: intradiol ring-cleavage dioxygenase [Bdellovibrionaceae bacterium]|nr:intradiol ring-cleavage dioxygenase [Pseudobdellovibrionaceae bacterium]